MHAFVRKAVAQLRCGLCSVYRAECAASFRMWCSEVTCSLIRRCQERNVPLLSSCSRSCQPCSCMQHVPPQYLHENRNSYTQFYLPPPPPVHSVCERADVWKVEQSGFDSSQATYFFFCPAKLPRSALLSGYSGRCVKPQSCAVLRMDRAIPTLTICQHCLPRDSYDHTRSHAALVY
jgi:hypothetical protein